MNTENKIIMINDKDKITERIKNALHQPTGNNAMLNKLEKTFEVVIGRWQNVVMAKCPQSTESSCVKILKHNIEKLKLSIVEEHKNKKVNAYADLLMDIFEAMKFAGIQTEEVSKFIRIKTSIVERFEANYIGDGVYVIANAGEIKSGDSPFCDHVFPPNETPVCTKCGIDKSDSLPYQSTEQ